MAQFPPDVPKTLEALKKAVARELERKRHLGHYAVVWRDGRPVAIGEDAPDELREAPERSTETGR